MCYAGGHPSRACSISAALLVASDVAGNPVSHTLIIDISVFAYQELIIVKIICELVWIYLYEPKGSNLDK